MSQKPAVLYHGSPVPLERLEPRPARGVGPEKDRLTAVYASHLRNFAIAFALQPVITSGAVAWEMELEADGTPRIRYRHGRPTAGGVGYLYTVPPDTFEQVDEYQWVSYVPVEPVGCETIRVDDYLHWVEVAEDSATG